MKNLFIIVSLLVFFALGFMAARYFPPGGLFTAPEPDTVMVTKVIPGDIRLVEIETTVPEPVLIDTGAFQIIEITKDIDTNEILADYFRTRRYEDTLTDDTSFRAVYNATVNQNRLTGFSYQHQNLRETAVYETHIHHYNRALMAGADVMLAPDRFNLGPSLLYHNRNEAYQLSVGLLQKEFRFGYLRSLWIPKKPP